MGGVSPSTSRSSTLRPSRGNPRPGKAVRDAAAAVRVSRRRDDRPRDPAPGPRADGRTSLPEGKARALFLIAFVVLPPVALKAVLQPSAGAGARRADVGPHVWPAPGPRPGPDDHRRHDRRAPRAQPMAAAPDGGAGRQRRRSRGRPVESPVDDEADRVHRARRPANAVFPRGLAFPGQVDRADFHEAWDALDDATRSLEGGIAADRHLGLGIATAARRPHWMRAVASTRCSGWPTTAARRPGSDRRHAMTTSTATREQGRVREGLATAIGRVPHTARATAAGARDD